MSDYYSQTADDLPLFAAAKPVRPAMPIDVRDPNAEHSDRARLRGQNAAILRRLEKGPATNDELAAISRKYTSRISDVRAWLQLGGRTIVCDRGEAGLNRYRIEVQR